MINYLQVSGCSSCPFAHRINSMFYCYGLGRSLSNLIGAEEDLDKYSTKGLPKFCPLKGQAVQVYMFPAIKKDNQASSAEQEEVLEDDTPEILL